MKIFLYFIVLLVSAGVAYWFGYNQTAATIDIMEISATDEDSEAKSNDFPTAARAEYVFACMGGSHRSPQALYACSCKIDVIADLMSYKDYLAAETAAMMRLMTGERYVGFKNSEIIKKRVDRFKNASIEAVLRCPPIGKSGAYQE